MKEEIKDYIKRIRKENGMTVKMFGDKLGKSPRTVEGWEQGHRTPYKATMALIEKTFRCERKG